MDAAHLPGRRRTDGHLPEHMLCCFISEDVGIELIDRFNIDNVCWESDYPHSDTTGRTHPRWSPG